MVPVDFKYDIGFLYPQPRLSAAWAVVLMSLHTAAVAQEEFLNVIPYGSKIVQTNPLEFEGVKYEQLNLSADG